MQANQFMYILAIDWLHRLQHFRLERSLSWRCSLALEFNMFERIRERGGNEWIQQGRDEEDSFNENYVSPPHLILKRSMGIVVDWRRDIEESV